jgi:hypothetical protein
MASAENELLFIIQLDGMNLSIEVIIVVMVMASSMLKNTTKIGKKNNKKENIKIT